MGWGWWWWWWWGGGSGARDEVKGHGTQPCGSCNRAVKRREGTECTAKFPSRPLSLERLEFWPAPPVPLFLHPTSRVVGPRVGTGRPGVGWGAGEARGRVTQATQPIYPRN